jgi:hypothetical protein
LLGKDFARSARRSVRARRLRIQHAA